MAPLLPYDMFDVTREAKAAKRFSKMQNIYHRGQALAWDGREVLDELFAKHGDDNVTPELRPALARTLGPIMWGELAAWKIAAQLADELEELEPKLAATSQAHDEARHFYVFHDYLERVCGHFPRSVPRPAERLLGLALESDTLAKKVVAMQLQVEATALTLFHALREADIDPVLSELMIYYEKDEARHVGLGVQILPGLMAKMSRREQVAFTAHSLRVALQSIFSLKSAEPNFRAIGIDPRRIVLLGKSKQMAVFAQLFKGAPQLRDGRTAYVANALDALAEALWPAEGTTGTWQARAQRVWQVYVNGYEMVETVLDPTQGVVEPAPRQRLRIGRA